MTAKCPVCSSQVEVLASGNLAPHAEGIYTNLCILGRGGSRYRCKGSGRLPAKPVRRMRSSRMAVTSGFTR